MSDITNESIEPLAVSVKKAAQLLGLSTYVVYELTSPNKITGDPPAIPVRYNGTRKLIRVADLRAYLDRLPTERPEAS